MPANRPWLASASPAAPAADLTHPASLAPSAWRVARGGLVLQGVAVWLSFTLVYLLTLAGHHSESDDALTYALAMRYGDPAALFHPHHLVYNWLGWLAAGLAGRLGYDGGPLVPAQVLNAVLGALGVALLWVLLRHATGGWRGALIGCAFVGFSYAYWAFSVEVEVFALSTLLVILALAAAYRAVLRPSWQAFALLGLAHGLAVLGHLTNGLFGVVALLALVLTWRTRPLAGVLRSGLAYLGAVIATVVPPYLVAGLTAGLTTPRELADWLTGPLQTGLWFQVNLANLLKAGLGFWRAVVGGHFALSWDPVRGFVEERFANQNLREEIFLVRDFNPALAGLLLALTVVLAFGVLILLLGWLGRPPLPGRARRLAWLCLAWLVPMAGFFTWWDPSNQEFWIAPWVALAILLALPLSTRERSIRWRFQPAVAALTIGSLCAVNLLGSVWLQRNAQDDYWHQRVSWYEQNVSSSDLVVATFYLWGNYLSYYSGAQVLNVDPIFQAHGDNWEAAVAEIRRRVATSPAQRVFFSSEVFYPASDQYSRCVGQGALCRDGSLLRDEFLPRSHLVEDSPLEKVWQLDQAAD